MFYNIGNGPVRTFVAQAVLTLLIGCGSPDFPKLEINGLKPEQNAQQTYTVEKNGVEGFMRNSGPFVRPANSDDKRTFTASMEGTVASVSLQVLGVELGYGVVLVGDLSKLISWETNDGSAADIRDAIETAVQSSGYSISYSGNVVVVSEEGANISEARAHVHLLYVLPETMAQTISETFRNVRSSAQGRNLVFSGSQKDVTDAARMSVDLDLENLSSVSWSVVNLPPRVAGNAVELVEALSWSEEGQTVEVMQLDDTGLVVVTGYSNQSVKQAVELLERVASRDGMEIARTISVRSPSTALLSVKELFQLEISMKTVFVAADDETGTVVVRGDPTVVADVVQFLRTQGTTNDWVTVRAVVIETAVGSAVDRGLSLSWSNGSSNAGITLGGSDPANVTGGFQASINGGLNATIAWLQTDSRTRIVSKPSLSVRSGATASLNVGTQVPIIETQTNNTEDGETVTQSVSYRDTGVSLTVLPKILSDGRISVVVAQEYSNATENTYSTVDSPVFNQRKLETEIVVQPNELAVIAGLEGSELGRSHSGPKFLRFLGSNRSSETRLAIFITATSQDQNKRLIAAKSAIQALSGVNYAD